MLLSALSQRLPFHSTINFSAIEVSKRLASSTERINRVPSFGGIQFGQCSFRGRADRGVPVVNECAESRDGNGGFWPKSHQYADGPRTSVFRFSLKCLIQRRTASSAAGVRAISPSADVAQAPSAKAAFVGAFSLISLIRTGTAPTAAGPNSPRATAAAARRYGCPVRRTSVRNSMTLPADGVPCAILPNATRSRPGRVGERLVPFRLIVDRCCHGVDQVRDGRTGIAPEFLEKTGATVTNFSIAAADAASTNAGSATAEYVGGRS